MARDSLLKYVDIRFCLSADILLFWKLQAIDPIRYPDSFARKSLFGRFPTDCN